MSGGSFDYLYRQDTGRIVDSANVLLDMALLLRQIGVSDVADDLVALVAMFKMVGREVDRYRDLLHAIEWWQSSDYDPDDVHEAARKYRTSRDT